MTSSSWGISNRSRIAVACSITGRSDADPHRTPTNGAAPASATLLLYRPGGDVLPVVHAVEGDEGDRVVRPIPGLRQVLPPSAHREHPSPCRDHSTVPNRRARVEDIDIPLSS